MFSQKFLISVLVIGCCTIPASASLVGYCNVGPECSAAGSAFAAATTGDTFQNIDVTQGSLGGDSYTDLGVDFSDTAGLSLVTSLAGSWPVGGAVVAGSGVSTMTVTLPGSVNAIDFSVGTQDDGNFTITVTDGAGPTYVNGYLSGTFTSGAFFGITTTASFTSFSITGQESIDKLTLDDISIGSPMGDGDPSPTPEVATLLLVATGLFLMRFARRWMPRRASDQVASYIDQAPRRGTICTMSAGIMPE